MTNPRRFDGTDLGIGHSDQFISQLDEGNVDYPLTPLDGVAESGTWSSGVTGGLPEVVRTPASADHAFIVPIDLAPAYHSRGSKASEIGARPVALVAQYTVDTADPNDVRFLIQKVTQGLNGAPAVVTTLAGDDDADYDVDHNTAAERALDAGAPELHTVTVTIPSSERGFLRERETLQIRVEVDSTGTGTAAVTLKSSWRLKADRVHTDVSPS